jgi:hypothetical protein
MNVKPISKRAQRTLNVKDKPKRPCNLCGQLFIMQSRFSRFCGECKSEKAVYRFAEWLPDLSIAA